MVLKTTAKLAVSEKTKENEEQRDTTENICFISDSFLIELQYCKECLLWYFNTSNLAHAFLTCFLFFKQLAFT